MGGKGARVASRLAGIVAVAVVVICAGSLQVRGQCAVDEYLNGGMCTGCAHTSANVRCKCRICTCNMWCWGDE